MATLQNLSRLLATLMVLSPIAASAIDLSSVRLWGPSLTKTTGADCPAAYTVFPNVPIVEYPDTVTLVTSKLIANVTADTIQSERTARAQPYVNVPAGNDPLGGFVPVTQGADLYQIHYRSTNVSDQPTLVSGLVAVPTDSSAGGVVVYMHATEVSQEAGAPSTPSTEACAMVTAFAGNERVVAMPDYLGYGINDDLHPYPLGVENAPAGIDIIAAARELASRVQPQHTVGSALYITGYSEGGGNALWLARKLQETGDNTLRPTLIAPMSGNYDMTGATAHSLIVDQPLNLMTLAVKPLLLTFTAQAAWEIKDLAPDSLIVPSLVSWDQVSSLPLRAGGRWEVNVALAALMLSAYQGGYLNPQINPSVLMSSQLQTAIETNDLTNPAMALWAQNNNLQWIPQAPVYATGILQDQIVPFAGSNYPVPQGYSGGAPFFAQGNSQNLIHAMRAQGLASDRVAWCGIDGVRVDINDKQTQRITHLTGLIPVSILASRFIAQGSLAGLPQLSDPP